MPNDVEFRVIGKRQFAANRSGREKLFDPAAVTEVRIRAPRFARFEDERHVLNRLDAASHACLRH
jgi:hypothetical protein